MGRTKKAVQNQRIANRDRRRTDVARLYREGHLVKDIAALLKVTRQTIATDLCELHAQWLRQASVYYQEAQVRELLRLDVLEAEAWEGWARSKEPGVTQVTEEVRGGKDGDKVRTRTTRRHQVGDPQFLSEMRRIVECRCKILGLFVNEDGLAARTADAPAGPLELRKILAELTDAELEVLSGPYRRYRELLTRRFGGLN